MPYTRSPKKKGNNMSLDFPFYSFPPLLDVLDTAASVSFITSSNTANIPPGNANQGETGYRYPSKPQFAWKW